MLAARLRATLRPFSRLAGPSAAPLRPPAATSQLTAAPPLRSALRACSSLVKPIDPTEIHPYRVVQPWMGAWYTLREGDPVAMANREKLKGRRPPTRGRFIVQELDRRRRAKEHAAEPWRAGHFRVGDTLQVEHRPSLSEKVERPVGLCIGRHRRGLGSSFRLLCKPDGVAVEYQFFLYSPLLTSIEVRAKPRKRYRKSKLYYMRERVNEISFPKPIRRDDKGEVVVPKGKEGKKGPRR